MMAELDYPNWVFVIAFMAYMDPSGEYFAVDTWSMYLGDKQLYQFPIFEVIIVIAACCIMWMLHFNTNFFIYTIFMFFISWQGLGVFEIAPELHKDGECPSCLPHNGSSRERAPERATTMKGPALGGARGVQSWDHGSMWAILCRGRLAAPFRRGVQEGAQASKVQGGPSICQNMGCRLPKQWGRVSWWEPTNEHLVSVKTTIHSGWLTLWVQTYFFQ